MSMSQSFNSYMGYNNQMMGYNAQQHPTARDIQCGDVSQSTSQNNKNNTKQNNSSPANQSGKPKSQKQQNNEKISSKTNNNNNNSKSVPTETKQCSKPTEEGNKSKSGEDPTDNNNYMKQDTYQRTLEYVQQCQNWSTVVKDEVTSTTTEQKPTLNPNGTVTGYMPPTLPGVQQSIPAMPQLTDNIEFLTPLNPVSVSEGPNMVLNNLSSSLNSLQQENKYFQMLQ